MMDFVLKMMCFVLQMMGLRRRRWEHVRARGEPAAGVGNKLQLSGGQIGDERGGEQDGSVSESILYWEFLVDSHIRFPTPEPVSKQPSQLGPG